MQFTYTYLKPFTLQRHFYGRKKTYNSICHRCEKTLDPGDTFYSQELKRTIQTSNFKWCEDCAGLFAARYSYYVVMEMTDRVRDVKEAYDLELEAKIGLLDMVGIK